MKYEVEFEFVFVYEDIYDTQVCYLYDVYIAYII